MKIGGAFLLPQLGEGGFLPKGKKTEGVGEGGHAKPKAKRVRKGLEEAALHILPCLRGRWLAQRDGGGEKINPKSTQNQPKVHHLSTKYQPVFAL